MSVNTCAISGNLVADPVRRTAKSGAAVLNFTVAVGNRRRAEAGVAEETPMYFDCVMFGARAEGAAHVLRRGAHVTVQGSLRQSSFERGGARVYKVEIAVTELDVAGRAAQAPAAGAPSRQLRKRHHRDRRQGRPPADARDRPRPTRGAPP